MTDLTVVAATLLSGYFANSRERTNTLGDDELRRAAIEQARLLIKETESINRKERGN